MHAAPEPPFEVSFCAANRLLTTRWLTHWLPDQLPYYYADLLVLAQHRADCRCWLLDLRGHAGHPSGLGPWFSHRLAPRPKVELSSPIFIAYLLAPADYSHAIACTPPSLLHCCARQQVYPRFFEDNGAAHDWLRQQQALGVPAVASRPH